jgi:hypothetical protein
MNKPFLLLLGAFAIASGWALVSGDSRASSSQDATAGGPVVLGIASSHAQSAADTVPILPAEGKTEQFDAVNPEPPKPENDAER